MPDRLTKEQRSALMGRVRQRDTAPELALRSALHRRGLRFRKNVKGLPGSPDIVFPGAKVALFVDGDFWHGRNFDAWSAKLQPFWRAKIERNIERDRQNAADLEASGWQVLRVWEKDIKKHVAEVAEQVVTLVNGRRAQSGRRPSDEAG